MTIMICNATKIKNTNQKYLRVIIFFKNLTDNHTPQCLINEGGPNSRGVGSKIFYVSPNKRKGGMGKLRNPLLKMRYKFMPFIPNT